MMVCWWLLGAHCRSALIISGSTLAQGGVILALRNGALRLTLTGIDASSR